MRVNWGRGLRRSYFTAWAVWALYWPLNRFAALPGVLDAASLVGLLIGCAISVMVLPALLYWVLKWIVAGFGQGSAKDPN